VSSLQICGHRFVRFPNRRGVVHFRPRGKESIKLPLGSSLIAIAAPLGWLVCLAALVAGV
jgi:hypothetical protein